jgi:hypothetical protein
MQDFNAHGDMIRKRRCSISPEPMPIPVLMAADTGDLPEHSNFAGGDTFYPFIQFNAF